MIDNNTVIIKIKGLCNSTKIEINQPADKFTNQEDKICN